MVTIQAHIPEQLHQQAQLLVQRGWISNLDELITESLRRYLKSHQERVTENFVQEDVAWGLRDYEHIQDDDLRLSQIAMQRAALRARELAQKTGTKIVVSRDGIVEHLTPDSVASVHEPVAPYKQEK